LTTVSVAGQPDFKARDNSAEISSTPELVSAETTAPTAQPASSGPFGAKREIPKFERVRGGGCSPDRTSLSLQFWEMQGDFAEMQGNATRTSAERPRFSIAYQLSSLLKEQGDHY
jgi:hypothetical protein